MSSSQNGSPSSAPSDVTTTTTTTTHTTTRIRKLIPPEKLTVQKLKSLLTASNVELPPDARKKTFYVDLFREKIGEGYVEEVDVEESDEETTTQEIPTAAAPQADVEKSATHITPTRTRRRKDREGSDLDDERTQKRRRVSTNSSASSQPSNIRRTSVHVLPKNTILSTRRGALAGRPVTTRDLWAGRADIFSETGSLSETDRRFSGASTFVSTSLLEPTTAAAPGSARRSFSATVARPLTPLASSESLDNVPPAQPDLATPASHRSDASTPVDEEFVKRFQTPHTATDGTPDPFLISRDLAERSPIPDLSPSRTYDLERGPILQFLSQVFKILFWGLMFWGVYIIVSQQRARFDMDQALPFYGPSYCDSEKFCGTEAIPNFVAERCQPCPLHGYCCNGKLETCEEPYVRHRAQCVDPSETPSPALHLASFLQEILSNHAGLFECKEKTSRGLSTSHARQLLLKEFLHGYSISPEISPSDETLKQFELTYSKLLKLIEDPVNGISIVNDQMESNVAVKPLQCVVSEAAQKYRVVICGIAFLLLLFASVQLAYKKLQERKYLLEDKIILTLTRLRDVARCTVQELKDELVEDYGEKQIGEDWESINKFIEADPRVQSMEDDDGRLLWEWIGEPLITAASIMSPRDLTDELNAETS
mmetsp:Transcript_9762/g.36377  ORF Transcript_9762/g.36377 Transcript_9762/m.36377 type:complete len:654 (+) Transcript_9762:378-2339(+)